MGIALLSLSTLFEQLHLRTARRNPVLRAPAPAGSTGRVRTTGLLHEAATRRRHAAAVSDTGSCRPGVSRPLRVVQVTDPASRSGAFGRLLMSGRMADVCAELERLSALEEGRSLH